MKVSGVMKTMALAIVVLHGPAMAQDKPATPTAASQPRMTCSFVAEECMKGCGATAPQFICAPYCDGHKKTCLDTGAWNGTFRQFDNLIRE